MNKRKLITNIISIVILIIFLIWAWGVYQEKNFNDFVKAEYKLGTSQFTRDKNVKCTEFNSYKITSEDFNDAMFSKTVDVRPNTVYRVKAKIKTENVIQEDQFADTGAHICIGDTFEKSNNVIGTTDWTEVTFYFYSKNRDKVNIGFRLGGAEGEAKGTAWFSDFSMEAGVADVSKKWNFLCLVFNNVDINLDGQNVRLQLTQIDKDDITTCMKRFKTSMEELSARKMTVDYNIIEVQEPITHFSYDQESGYYVSGNDIKNVLDKYLEEGKYDHVFVAFRMGTVNQNFFNGNDWIGLGSMEYRGVGYSNIRIPDDDKSYIYKYDTRINTFPEEVLVHEFLHTLERNAEENGYARPELHSNEEYKYPNQKMVGLKNWYQDYMNKNITGKLGKVGLPEQIYTIKPAKSTDFEYSHKLDAFEEPDNIIEEINMIVKRFKMLFEDENQMIAVQKEGANESIGV